jgi:aspartate/methionine/tyrosine aminotransferase
MSSTRFGFRDLPFMGVIHVNNEAMKAGWRMGDPNWSNLGQGQPEVGDITGAPARLANLAIDPADHAYGPVEGVPEYREAIAAHYNRLYRQGKASQYTAENVCVAPGGRAALTRLAAAMDRTRMGYFTPDYTAYEDMLTTFTRIDPVHIELKAETGCRIDPGALEQRVERDRLGALLISNPCNPTGVVISGPELKAWVDLSRRRRCTLLMDEFYSHFVYSSNPASWPSGKGVSAAEFVEDVNSDPVVIVDGLTKCFRYPGWRSGWVVAPKPVIQAMTAAGSFLDGGPSRPMQRLGIKALQQSQADQETNAVRAVFAEKQRLTLGKLREAGVRFPVVEKTPQGAPTGTFYVWGDISGLPPAINHGEGFMRAGFGARVLVVPGVYFDVNPGKGRAGESPLKNFVRFSFGPPRQNLEAGLDRLVAMIASHKR